jgi:hypothetical protein
MRTLSAFATARRVFRVGLNTGAFSKRRIV